MFALLSLFSRVASVQPSSWAGLALVADGVAGVVASKGADHLAWSKALGGVAAIIKNEAGAQNAN